LAIYVEIVVRGSIDQVWRLTQTPKLHERWDLRFSCIDYLPRPNLALPQRFQYSTRIGFGIRIKGEGETSATRDSEDGARTSVLTFWSDDPKSLILKGSGYWRYAPIDDGVRFITGYDYRTRFGLLGRGLDAILFRPLLGWATAWSFDRLRLWIERGIDPEVSGRLAAAYALGRIAIAFVFLYHGIVPKLLHQDADEQQLLMAAGLTKSLVPFALHALGWVEVAFGALLLLAWRSRWPLIAVILGMLGAIGAIAFAAPAYLVRAFNPLTLNVLVGTLAAINLWLLPYLPTAGTCIRKRPVDS